MLSLKRHDTMSQNRLKDVISEMKLRKIYNRLTSTTTYMSAVLLDIICLFVSAQLHLRAYRCCIWIHARKDSGRCRKIGTVYRLSSSGRAESEDAAYSADILRKLRMTSLPATSSDTVNNGSRASGKSGKHQPSAPSAHYTSEKVAPTSLGMSLFLDAPLPPGTARCCLS